MYKRRYRDIYENTYEDRYNKNRNSYRDKNKNKDRYRDDSYDRIGGKSKEKDWPYDDREGSFNTKPERVYKILQWMGQEKEMIIGFMLTVSENPDIILDSIYTKADVDHLIEERIGYVKNQEVENLTDENSSSQNDINYVNC